MKFIGCVVVRVEAYARINSIIITSLSLAAVSSQSVSISLLSLVDLVVFVNVLIPFDAVAEVVVIVVDPMIEFVADNAACAGGAAETATGSVI